MSAVPDDSDIPWHRVINARGEVSRRSRGSAFERIQRALLEAEGVAFDAQDRVSLPSFRWDPPASDRPSIDDATSGSSRRRSTGQT
jgi:methylated-DNA-protein-cysteine methyltransferase-like protein